MRKTIKSQSTERPASSKKTWFGLADLAEVEVTSKDADHPIEQALFSPTGGGWRAATSGDQAIHLWFDQPQNIRNIRLEFQELERSRTQEFCLSWSGDDGTIWREILRQKLLLV